jgi:protein O-GlcNAcase/histone acetyltransferase
MKSDFLSGVIEGFYGTPWTIDERMMVLDWMQSFGLNTYLYAPKDDLKQRLLWRTPYTHDETSELKGLIDACHARGVRFVFAISPGLDMAYAQASEFETLQHRLEQVHQLGVSDFALLFDDIPDTMRDEDRQRFGTFALAQSHVANRLFRWLQERDSIDARFLFCPTPYCGRMQKSGLGGERYLEEIGQNLDDGIDVFWTGPEIISSQISQNHIDTLTDILRRPPLIWDNLHANDYDGHRFYCGPYSGRPLELRSGVKGILHNPNNEASLNFVPWKTLSDFIHAGETWNPRESYLSAMKQWHENFESAGSPIRFEDFVLLGDCFYLPDEEGGEAAQLFDACEQWFKASSNPTQTLFQAFQEPAIRLRNVCAEIVNLKDRKLFSALHRKTWDLREEMDLLLTCGKCMQNDPPLPLQSDFHLPGTYRGGMVSKLSGLLKQQPDETFIPVK